MSNEEIRVVIADDEPGMRMIMRKMIEKAVGFTLCGEADNGPDLLKLVEQYKPQVCFLDVEMPGMTGLECAKAIQDTDPRTILVFATAHEDYMAQAFEVYAFDYMVKPFKVERVMKTLERIRQVIGGRAQPQSEQAEKLEEHIKAIPARGASSGRIMLHHKEGVNFINQSDILLVQRENRSTVLYATNGRRFETSEALGDVEARLDPKIFFRCHKSYIINLNVIDNITPYGRWTYVVHLTGTTQDALKAGISTVYQEITLCPNLTVAENLYIGRTKGAFTNWRKMNADAKKLLESLGIPAAPTQQLSSCSIAVQQMVAIARAVDMECKVLILDEPTSSLDEQEVEKLFKLMLDLKSRGVGIIFVTHFLEQVYAVCDRITVLRDGKLVGEYKIADLPRVQLVSKMLGKELDDLSEIKSEGAADALEGAEVVYEAAGLSSAAGVRPFDFSIRKGEVNGFTGLLGSGRSESVRAIFGADYVSGGTVKMDGKQVKITSPLRAMKHGISYLPEDRKRDGIIGDLSVRDNIILARQVLDGFFHPISKAKAEKYAEEYIRLLSIKTASTDTPIKSLSGGNQQKVILARWLLANPVYMILDEPTRGIDVGTKVEIQKLVLQLAAEGKSVTFISSEIDEMLRVCSRLVVMRDRQVVGELRGSDLNQSSIMKTIAGGEQA